MANKSPKTAKKQITKTASSATTKVTRITASDDTSAQKPAKPAAKLTKNAAVRQKTAAETTAEPKRRPLKKVATPFTLLIGYFKGAWYELRQVRWPNRRSTWGLTGALIAFTLFFVILILILDALFKYVFELILK